MSDKNQNTSSADVALEPYWQAARAGRLLLKLCRACGKSHYYPRPLCPFCMSSDTEWREASGKGSIYSWSVERRATPPYAIAFVALAEGPTLLTNIVDRQKLTGYCLNPDHPRGKHKARVFAKLGFTTEYAKRTAGCAIECRCKRRRAAVCF